MPDIRPEGRTAKPRLTKEEKIISAGLIRYYDLTTLSIVNILNKFTADRKLQKGTIQYWVKELKSVNDPELFSKAIFDSYFYEYFKLKSDAENPLAEIAVQQDREHQDWDDEKASLILSLAFLADFSPDTICKIAQKKYSGLNITTDLITYLKKKHANQPELVSKENIERILGVDFRLIPFFYDLEVSERKTGFSPEEKIFILGWEKYVGKNKSLKKFLEEAMGREVSSTNSLATTKNNFKNEGIQAPQTEGEFLELLFSIAGGREKSKYKTIFELTQRFCVSKEDEILARALQDPDFEVKFTDLQKRVLTAVYLKNLTYEKAAVVCGISLRAVRQICETGRAKVKNVEKEEAEKFSGQVDITNEKIKSYAKYAETQSAREILKKIIDSILVNRNVLIPGISKNFPSSTNANINGINGMVENILAINITLITDLKSDSDETRQTKKDLKGAIYLLSREAGQKYLVRYLNDVGLACEGVYLNANNLIYEGARKKFVPLSRTKYFAPSAKIKPI